jgi:RNA polymerase sigma-70 factor (ECF subfamily)
MVALRKEPIDSNMAEILIRNFKKGRETAVDAIWNAFSKDLYYLSFDITKDMGEAEDIVVNGFIELWQRRQDFENIHKVKNFLFVHTRNLSINFYNLKKRRGAILQKVALSLPDKEDAISAKVVNAELLGLFNEVLEQLSPQQQQIIQATMIEGASGRQVAEALSIAESTLYREKNKAIEIMKEFAERHRWKYPTILPYLLAIYDLTRHPLN